jgi:small subunit ribosomal protein S6
MEVQRIDPVQAYETVFILKPTLEPDEYSKVLEEYKGWLQEQGGVIVHEEVWGMRRLAYPIKKFQNGYYLLIEFRIKASAIKKLDQKFRLDERVIRWLVVKLDKYGIEFNQRRREKMKSAQVTTE